MDVKKWLEVLKAKTRITGIDLVLFLLASLLALVLEEFGDHIFENEKISGPKGTHAAGAKPLFELNGVYQRLLTGGPRKPISKFTILVDVNDRNDRYYRSLFEQVKDACEQRMALARLIDKIASAGPAVIALDAQFAETQCRKGSEQTAILRDVIARVGSTTPLVVGRKLDDEGRLIPVLSFSTDPRHPIQEGMLELDTDTKKLPLKWPIEPDSTVIPRSGTYDFKETFALITAHAYDSDLMKKYPRIKEFFDENKTRAEGAIHPYVSFLQPEQFVSYAAGELLCGKNYANAAMTDTVSHCEPLPEALHHLHGKIVLVGAKTKSDRHLSPVGELDGFVMHANYIEALLDQRYYTPVHPLVNLLFGIAMFVAILFSLREPSPVKGALLVVAIVAISYLLVFFSVMFLGYYLNPTFISAAWLVTIIGHHIYEKVLHGARNFVRGMSKK